ncbi:ADP-ribose diphosphatase [Shewanella sp. NIFS-20-20]|uniref:ADP-ribose diphosphatase n=1 Tax=Shewanella sp. NIFS-20-20 TaxID=2853806 RepID=UPI001C43F17B|nr:ADP-ribose diphosphatase [Shewanella sp. NIFS-20-20]MBV7317052.1 ADP-ribose diphosphatase [Shewanella sp. NIFS-20-20]
MASLIKPKTTQLQSFGKADVELLEQSCLFQGFFQLRQYRFKHKLFDGGWSEAISREVFERGDAVVVLPYDPVRDQVVLIEQIRIPALASSTTPWLLELVAGMIEHGEDRESVARRELFEETGLQCESMTAVSQYLPSPGGSSERLYFYWAKVDASQAEGVHGLAEEHEDIRLHVVARQHAYDLLEQGRIDNAATVIGIQWLQLHYSRLMLAHANGGSDEA